MLREMKYRRGEMTHDEIAIILGISRQRVIQIEEKALRKARRILRRRGLSIHDLIPSATVSYERSVRFPQQHHTEE